MEGLGYIAAYIIILLLSVKYGLIALVTALIITYKKKFKGKVPILILSCLSPGLAMFVFFTVGITINGIVSLPVTLVVVIVPWTLLVRYAKRNNPPDFFNKKNRIIITERQADK